VEALKTLLFGRWVEPSRQTSRFIFPGILMWDYNILYADISSKDEQLLIRLLLGMLSATVHEFCP
jgi:hypothetical protein